MQDSPIQLKVQRRDSPNLTLIDLPGIAYNSADESLVGSIADMTKSLIDKYIQEPNMIIVVSASTETDLNVPHFCWKILVVGALECFPCGGHQVVIPAADDFASHESLKMASKYDPKGLRTLGVVTKTDRIEDGSSFVSKMRAEGNGHIKLRLGWVAVKNRTQKEVDENVPLAVARQSERHFFESDPRLVSLDRLGIACLIQMCIISKMLHRDLWGMDTLISKIVDIQTERVREFIPKTIQMLSVRIKELEEAMKRLPPTHTSDEGRRAFVIDLVRASSLPHVICS